MKYCLPVFLFTIACLSADADTVLYRNTFDGALSGLNEISGHWWVREGRLFGSAEQRWTNGPKEMECEEVEGNGPVLVQCWCTRNCDSRLVDVPAVAVKRLSLPRDFTIRASNIMPLNLMPGVMTFIPATSMIFDFQNQKNYKGISFAMAPNRSTGITYLRCQRFEMVSGTVVSGPSTTCARLDDTGGLFNIALKIRGKDLSLIVNGINHRTFQYEDFLNDGAIGFQPYREHAGWDYLQVGSP